MRIYYKGSNKGDSRRIKTGIDRWDNNLFCTKDREKALWYGKDIEVIKLKEGARVLTEGTKEFSNICKNPKSNESLLDWCVRCIIRANEAGYHVVEFKNQGDIGTAIMDEDFAIRNFKVLS